FFFFQAEDGIRDFHVTGVQTCALPILGKGSSPGDTGRLRPRARRAHRPRSRRRVGHAHTIDVTGSDQDPLRSHPVATRRRGGPADLPRTPRGNGHRRHRTSRPRRPAPHRRRRAGRPEDLRQVVTRLGIRHDPPRPGRPARALHETSPRAPRIRGGSRASREDGHHQRCRHADHARRHRHPTGTRPAARRRGRRERTDPQHQSRYRRGRGRRRRGVRRHRRRRPGDRARPRRTRGGRRGPTWPLERRRGHRRAHPLGPPLGSRYGHRRPRRRRVRRDRHVGGLAGIGRRGVRPRRGTRRRTLGGAHAGRRTRWRHGHGRRHLRGHPRRPPRGLRSSPRPHHHGGGGQRARTRACRRRAASTSLAARHDPTKETSMTDTTVDGGKAAASTEGALETRGIEPVPESERHGHPMQLFWVWFAANISILGLPLGATLVAIQGLTFWQAVIVAVLGAVGSFAIVGVVSIAGRRGGAPGLTLSRAVFGVRGSAGPTLVSLISRLGWETVNTTTAAFALLSLFAIVFGTEPNAKSAPVLTIVCIAVFVLLTVIVSGLGHRVLVAVQRWATWVFGALNIVVAVSLVTTVDWQAVGAATPASLGAMIAGVGTIAAGTGIGWANA